MKNHLLAAAALAALVVCGTAQANGLLQSANGYAQIGINETGELDASTDAGFVGLGYKFTGQASRTGFQDALTPGCACEAWGVAANGLGGQVGQSTGNQNIGFVSSSTGANSFTSVTRLTTVPGLTITQTYSRSFETATGALFKNTVTIQADEAVTDVRYTRAMDWDVPPTEFSEYTTFKGTATTSNLLRSTDNGFANANPMSAVLDGGILGPIDADGITGPGDHGSLFTFGFGSLAAGKSLTFNIFYGAGANEADALSLLSGVGPELYTLGQSNVDGVRGVNLPTYVFGFSGVGGTVVVPPPAVPEPGTYALMVVGLAGLAFVRRRVGHRDA